MRKKVFFVSIAEIDGNKKKYNRFYVEADDAREAFEKVDRYTGTYPVEMIIVREETDANIYPTNRT